MTCQQSQEDWHSYVKNSLSESEMSEISDHLTHCATCREVVADIKAMAVFLADKSATPLPPQEITRNVLAAIDKNKYQRGPSLLPFDLKHWGFSLVAAGLIMLLINPAPLAAAIARVNNKLGRQISQPFDQMGLATQTALAKAEILYTISNKKTQKNYKEEP